MSFGLLRLAVLTPSFVCLALAVSLAGCSSSDDAGAPATTDTGTAPSDTSTSDGSATDTSSKPDTTTTDGIVTDTFVAPTDTAPGTDTASSGDTAGVVCGAVTCPTTQVCCITPKDGGIDQACATSCSDGGLPLACDGPEDCSGAGKICCGTISIGAGSPPTCPISGGSSSCVSTCTTVPPGDCPSTATVRLCHAKSDCAGDTSNPNCCTFSGDGTSGSGAEATFCVSDLLKAFGGPISCAD